MKAYDKTLKLRKRVWMTLLTIGLIPLLIPRVSDLRFPPEAENSLNLLQGLLAAFQFSACIQLWRIEQALRNPEKQKAMYIAEYDERTREIKLLSGVHITIPCAFILLAASIVFGVFQPLVSYSLLGCAVFLCIVSLGLKLYYSNTL